MFIKDGVYRNVDISGLTAPILEGTVLTATGAIAAADGSDAFGIVPENIFVMPPTKMTRVAIGGTIDMQDPANKDIDFTENIIKALGRDINFIPAAEAVMPMSRLVQYNVAEIGVDNLQITSNSVVYFPKGTYEIDADKTITVNGLTNVKFIGDNATIKLKDQAEIIRTKKYNLIHLIQCENIDISGITFDGNRDNLGIEVTNKITSDLSGIRLDDCQNITIHDNKFLNFICFGVYARDITGGQYENHNISNLNIHDNYFYKCMNAAKIIEGLSNQIIFSRNICLQMDTHGISLYPTATNVIVTDNVIEAGVLGEYNEESGTGIRFYETNNVICTGNIILSARQAGILEEIRPSNLNPVVPKNITISGNQILSVTNGNGIVCKGDNAIINDNIIKNVEYSGIRIIGDNCDVKNNKLDTISAISTSCITIDGDDCSVLNNKIVNAGNIGIDCLTGHTGLVIDGNSILGDESCQIGIRIVANTECYVGLNIIKNASKYAYSEASNNVTFTTEKLIYHGNFNITSTSLFSGTIDGLADSVVIPRNCTLVSVEAFLENSVTTGSARFRLKKNGTVVTYDFAPSINSGKSITNTVKKGWSSTDTTRYFDKGDILTVECVPSSDLAPIPNTGMIRITFDCDR